MIIGVEDAGTAIKYHVYQMLKIWFLGIEILVMGDKCSSETERHIKSKGAFVEGEDAVLDLDL